MDLGDRIGCWRFSLFSTPELDEVGHKLSDCNVFIYSYLPGFRTAMAAAVVAFVPMPHAWAVGLLRRAFRSVSLSVGGFAVVRVLGRSEGQEQVFTSRLVFERQREYWLNGVVAATTARMVSEGKGVRAGVRFLAEAVEPSLFMSKLRGRGVDQVDDGNEPES